MSQWARIVHECGESGMSIRAYCRSVGIRENVYYYWKRKLREAACQKIILPVNNEAEKALIPSGWAVCETHEIPREKKALVIEVGGCRITVEADVDPELLAKTVKMLKSLC